MGTRELYREARRRGIELWVYTSSMRSTATIRLLFAAHGLWLGCGSSAAGMRTGKIEA
jgi:hypothetical protein